MGTTTVAVLGGSGFIGTYVVGQLVQAGKHVKAATRRRQNAAHLTLPPIDVIEVDVNDPLALERFLQGADTVINLVGILHGKRGSPYGPEFARAHVELPRRIVSACRKLGIRRLLHVSALGANSSGPSMYLRSKGDGEQAVRASGLDTTIFRPSVVFGPEDAFLNTFASMQRMFPVIPLACPDAKFQPVFVGDVSKAIVTSVDLDMTIGKTYELGGPGVYTLEQLVRFAGRTIGRSARIIRLPAALARWQALGFEFLPGKPVITRDNLDSMSVDNVTSAPIAPELDIEPASIETMAPIYLAGVMRDARFKASRSGAHR